MAIQSQPSRIPQPFAGSGTKNTIPATNSTPSASQAASWASGFPPECSQPLSAGGCPVPRNDVNGALNQISQDYAFRQDGGVWEWSALADYDAGRFVRGSDSGFYKAVAQNGPGTSAGAKDPTADDGTHWVKMPSMADIAAQDFASNSAVVHNTGNETVAGTKTFTSAIIGNATGLATASELGDSYEMDADDFGGKNAGVWHVSTFKANTSSAPAGNVGDYTVLKLDAVDTGYSCFLCASPRDNRLSLGHFWNGAWSGWIVLFDSANDAQFTGSANTVKLDRDTDTLYLAGGSSIDSNSFLALNGKSSPNLGNPGSFYLHAKTDQNTDIVLAGHTSGTLQWNGQTVQTTSDRRLKTELSAVPDSVLDAWGHVSWGEFKYLKAMEEKGAENSRLHIGIVAQDVDDVFKGQGEDILGYGILCHDEREATDKEPAADLWMVRYTEALCMEAAYQRRRADRAEARLAALEERLAAIEAKLG